MFLYMINLASQYIPTENCIFLMSFICVVQSMVIGIIIKFKIEICNLQIKVFSIFLL